MDCPPALQQTLVTLEMLHGPGGLFGQSSHTLKQSSFLLQDFHSGASTCSVSTVFSVITFTTACASENNLPQPSASIK